MPNVSFKVGTACNKGTGAGKSVCMYCYEEPIRFKHGNKGWEFNVDNIKTDIIKQVKERGLTRLTLHGGEPLWVLDIKKLEDIFSFCVENGIKVGIQTNGTILSDKHIDIIKKYNVHISLSIDGHLPEMNMLRNSLNIEYSKNFTRLLLKNIKKLTDNMDNCSIGIITVLHKFNVRHPYGEIKEWLSWLYEKKIYSVRLNEMIAYNDKIKKYELNEEELGDFFVSIYEYSKDFPNNYWQPISDLPLIMFTNTGGGTCIFTKCDYYKTAAEQVISGDGTLRNCLKTGYNGEPFVAPEEYSYERYQILSQTPYEDGGCKGCEYWNVCYGLCPGSAIDNDWRNRGRFCLGYKKLYKHYHRDIVASGILRRSVANKQFIPDLPSSYFQDKSSVGKGGNCWIHEDSNVVPCRQELTEEEARRKGYIK